MSRGRLLYTERGVPQYEFSGPQMLFAQVLLWLDDPKQGLDLCQCQPPAPAGTLC